MYAKWAPLEARSFGRQGEFRESVFLYLLFIRCQHSHTKINIPKKHILGFHVQLCLSGYVTLYLQPLNGFTCMSHREIWKASVSITVGPDTYPVCCTVAVWPSASLPPEGSVLSFWPWNIRMLYFKTFDMLLLQGRFCGLAVLLFQGLGFLVHFSGSLFLYSKTLVA